MAVKTKPSPTTRAGKKTPASRAKTMSAPAAKKKASVKSVARKKASPAQQSAPVARGVRTSAPVTGPEIVKRRKAQTTGTIAKQITIAIDHKKKERFLSTSEVASLRRWEATEAELYAEMLTYYPNYTLERIIREGAISFAKRKIAEARSVKLKGQVTRLGSADNRLAAAHKRLLEDNRRVEQGGPGKIRQITPWTLCETAKTSWKTAYRWLTELKESQERAKH